MPLLNYTTEVAAAKTVAQIMTVLQNHGAKSIMINYGQDRQVESLSFLVQTPQGDAAVKLPVNPDAVLKVMSRWESKVPNRYQNKEQAVKVAWRIVKDWVEAQMAILETEMVTMDQVFLPYINFRDGKTVYQLYQEGHGSGLLKEG